MKFIAIQKEGKTFQLIYITSLQVYVQKVGLINYIYYFSTVLYLCICMKPHINEAYVYMCGAYMHMVESLHVSLSST